MAPPARTITVALVMSKAFDTINIHTLTGVSFELIRSYLTNRKQYVKFKTLESDYMDVKSGVPQGSILCPLLFSIYINDIVAVNKKFKFLMYADDTTIYFNLEDFSGINVEENVSNELNKVNSCLSLNKLSLNTDKTKCMTFHTRQKNIDQLTFSIHSHNTRNNNLQRIHRGPANFTNLSARVWNVLTRNLNVYVPYHIFKLKLKLYLMNNSLELKYSK